MKNDLTILPETRREALLRALWHLWSVVSRPTYAGLTWLLAVATCAVVVLILALSVLFNLSQS